MSNNIIIDSVTRLFKVMLRRSDYCVLVYQLHLIIEQLRTISLDCNSTFVRKTQFEALATQQYRTKFIL